MSRMWLLKARFFASVILLGWILAGCEASLNPFSLKSDVVDLGFEGSTIAFDDISYDPSLGKVLVPAAETGTLVLVDPQNKVAPQWIQQYFSKQTDPNTPVIGTTSAIVAHKMIFALDRAAQKIFMINPSNGQLVSSATLQDSPDYIRFVSATNELWVTETNREQIEVFPLDTKQPPTIGKPTVISVPNGPEALLIDGKRGLAYTNQPKTGFTSVISVFTHRILTNWGNGCSKSRGMALDPDRGYLFVACNEGKLVVMDINTGLQLVSQNFGGKLDFVAYNPTLKHVYLPSASSGILGIFGVVETPIPTLTPGAGGTPIITETPGQNAPGSASASLTPTPGPKVSLALLGTADTGLKAKCVTFDNQGGIWVCDPNHGQLFRIQDNPDLGN